jgi:hypothetical protein
LRADDVTRVFVALRRGRLDPDPIRLFGLHIIGLVGLFRVALVGKGEIAQRFFPCDLVLEDLSLPSGHGNPCGCRGAIMAGLQKQSRETAGLAERSRSFEGGAAKRLFFNACRLR